MKINSIIYLLNIKQKNNKNKYNKRINTHTHLNIKTYPQYNIFAQNNNTKSTHI
jgi:hypothetical protein